HSDGVLFPGRNEPLREPLREIRVIERFPGFVDEDDRGPTVFDLSLDPARKQNTVAVMMTQYASQLERTRTGKTIIEAVPTQVLLPNIRANASDYQMLNLSQKELDTLLSTGTQSRLALIRDDQGSIVVDADLSALGPNLTILGGMEAGEKRVGADYRDRPDFWRLHP
ncbi:MAG: hypothetical protein AAFR84_23360, partial [Pseudomonadota bacterium]